MSNTSATGGFLHETSAPATREQLENVWHDIIAGVCGLGAKMVRPEYQVDPAALPPVETNWAEFRLEVSGTNNFPYVVHVGRGEGCDRVVDHVPWRVTVFFYGPAAEDMAGMLRRGLHVEQNRSTLKRAGGVVTSCGAPVSVPELVNAKWRRRVDLTIETTMTMMSTFDVLNLKNAHGVIETPGQIFDTEGLITNG